MPTYVRLPAGIPHFLGRGLGFEDDPQYAHVERSTGHRRSRRVSVGLGELLSRTYTAGWILSSVEVQALDAWWESTLRVGTRRFIAPVRTEDDLQYWDAMWLAKYVANPIAATGDTLWEVTGQIITFGDPTDAPPETGELSASYGLALEGSAVIEASAAISARYGLALERAQTLRAEYGLALERFEPEFLITDDDVTIVLDDGTTPIQI